jgi:processive 1,2-diacylglycerol beta-glucosyltransferase
MSQRRHGLQVPVVTFQTSTFDTSALWAEPDCERIVLGGKRARDKLVALGVPADKIDLVGYPLRQTVLHAKSKQEARAALNLPDRFTCLLVLGGEGVGGDPESVIAALEGLELPLDIVVICGRNDALKVKLAARDAAHLHPVGYTEQMADYLAASDVVIGKTGATAVFEALAVGRPVLAPHRSGGIETFMIDVLAQHQLGGSAPLPDSLQNQVRAYYDEPAQLQAVYERTCEIDFAGLTRRLTDYLVHYARTGAPATRLRGSGLIL